MVHPGTPGTVITLGGLIICFDFNVITFITAISQLHWSLVITVVKEELLLQ
jgi:hypothetical protein